MCDETFGQVCSLPWDDSCNDYRDRAFPQAATRLALPAGRKGGVVLYTIAVVLIILWLLGLVSGYTIGAFIHVLLVIALVLVLAQFLSRRRVV